MNKTWARATAICGTLDIVYACIATMLRSTRPPLQSVEAVLHSVAAGSFGDSIKDGGWPTALLGLATHYAIMAVMVAVFLAAYARFSAMRRLNPLLLGTIYGLILYVVMNDIVLALRYPAVFPQTDPLKILIALFPHIPFVGIPLAYMARQADQLKASAPFSR